MRTLVLHPHSPKTPARRTPHQSLNEAVSLARALDLDIVSSDIIRLPTIRAGTLFGKGKIGELAARIDADDIGLVVVDGLVTPVQQRNLEHDLRARILDRTGLILEIFGARAQTREGVLQVDLAALAYQRSRLVRSWTHLERQRGGLSFVGGAGETQIEADRRAIDDAIVRVRRQLAKVVKTRSLHRAARQKVPFPIVALIGYTNAGKSTLFNRLTGASVVAQDQLFATLDPTMRAVTLPGGRQVILSDTVGFISDLPTSLVAAFRATLEEVLGADLILHVRDIGHPETEAQARDVQEILTELGVGAAAFERMIEVWNKIDSVQAERRETLHTIVARQPKVRATSALTGQGLESLCAAIDAALQEPTSTQKLALDFAEGQKRAWLFAQNVVNSETQTEVGFDLSVTWTRKQQRRFEKL